MHITDYTHIYINTYIHTYFYVYTIHVPVETISI